VARRATVIKAARAQGGSLLLLDAGNSLVATLREAGSREPAERTHGQTSVEILNRLGYDAVALGAKDLLLSKEELQKRIGEAEGFSFLSANLRDRASGQLLAAPYLIKELAGHRVGLLGITGPIPEGSATYATDPSLETAREHVRILRPQADLVILLSNAGLEENKLIAEQVPGIDLIISGGGQTRSAEPWRSEQGTLVVQADSSSPRHAGRYVGQLQLELDSGTLAAHTWASIELGPAIADDPEFAGWAAQCVDPQHLFLGRHSRRPEAGWQRF
jgi:2',3'-cyclic-nucleotide 2'-phosphodiesterase (5'-nucleotidase family)